jgi:hypothetical protein
MLVQFLIIGLGNEHCVVIEKMDFLLIAHAYVRMSAQKVMQRRGSGFLRAGKYEVEPLNFVTLSPKHQQNVHREARRGS